MMADVSAFDKESGDRKKACWLIHISIANMHGNVCDSAEVVDTCSTARCISSLCASCGSYFVPMIYLMNCFLWFAVDGMVELLSGACPERGAGIGRACGV